MNAGEVVFIVVACLSGAGVLFAAGWIGMRQLTIYKFVGVRKSLDDFTQSFNPGDLVRAPQRFYLGRAQAHLQTAEIHFAEGKKLLAEQAQFWAALNKFWDAEAHLDSAKHEVFLAQTS
jgi:hypothetical protein